MEHFVSFLSLSKPAGSQGFSEQRTEDLYLWFQCYVTWEMAATLKSRSRVISIRDTYSPRASRRNGLSSQSACSIGSGPKLYTRQTSSSCGLDEDKNEMAFTCKVQYLDDTDPFASTNFPEPTRPPSCTLYLNIPLCEQIAVLHKLLKPPHNVSEGISTALLITLISGHLCAFRRPDNRF